MGTLPGFLGKEPLGQDPQDPGFLKAWGTSKEIL